MKLIRYATVYLKGTDVSRAPLCFRTDTTTVEVQQAGLLGDKDRVLLQAAIELDAWPDVSSEGVVKIPDQERKATEAAIEKVANLLGVLNHSPRRIASPYPFVALFLESEEESRWASRLSRFLGEQSSIPETSYRFPASSVYLDALSDRLDGVTLLAEALAHRHATGKFHEFMRLFERAFALVPSQFDKKLAQFLQGAELGYDRAEVKSWIELRNPATHANDLTQDRIVLESDVRPFIARIEQAAYDVLMNKKDWKNSSKERRQVWRPTVATVSSRNALRITKGLNVSFTINVIDPFDTFGYDASFSLSELPLHLWSSWPPTRSLLKGDVHLEEQPVD